MLGLAGASALAAAGCGNSGPGSSTLDAFVYQDASTTVQDKAVKAFNAGRKTKVKLDKVAGTTYGNKLRAVMGTPNAPDIFFNWGGGSIKPYVDAGRLLDLTSTLTGDSGFKDGFIQSVLDAGKLNDKYYGIPMRGMQPVILFYNTTLFAKHDWQPPQTWDALLGLAADVKKAGITPFALGGSDAWTEQMWLEYLVDRFAGPAVFQRIENGDSAGWKDSAILGAAQAARHLVDIGAFGDNYGSVGYVNNAASTLFAKGRAAMHLMGSWEFANQLAAAPDFAKNDLGYTRFPSVSGGKGDIRNVVGNPTNYWSVSSRVSDKSTAIAFLKYMATEQYAKWLVANGDVPTSTVAEGLLDSAPNPAYAKWQYQLVRQAPAFTLSWDQALVSSIATPMTSNIQKLFNKQLSPEQFVSTMAST